MATIPTYVRWEETSGELRQHLRRCAICDLILDGTMAGFIRLCPAGVAERTFDVVGFGDLDFEHGASGLERESDA